MTYQLNQKVIIKSLRRQGIIKEHYLARIWRVELLNGTNKLCGEHELKPMPEKKEKCCGNCSQYKHCRCDEFNCFEKVEKQSEPKGFKEENERKMMNDTLKNYRKSLKFLNLSKKYAELFLKYNKELKEII